MGKSEMNKVSCPGLAFERSEPFHFSLASLELSTSGTAFMRVCTSPHTECELSEAVSVVCRRGA